MADKKIYLSSPTMHGEEKMYVNDAFQKNWIAPLGENVDCFEEEVAKYVEIKGAVALCAGTAGLHLAIKLANIKQGDIVLCSSFTFIATCNPIVYEKATPVFIDSEEDTWNMSPEALEKGLEKYPQAKAVIVVNLYGMPAKLEQIRQICDKHHVLLIEDAAESLGATCNDKQTGTFGDYGVFSFNGNKIITSSGGGMLISDNVKKLQKARFFATQARENERYYQHNEAGYNYRMSNIVAGIGRGQLVHIDEHIKKKRAIYDTYKKALSDIEEVKFNPSIYENALSNCWLTCITLNESDRIKKKPIDVIVALEENNIESRPVWKPMHMQPVFKGCDYIKLGERDISKSIFESGICLPSDIKNTKEDMDKIIGIIRNVLEM